MVAERPAERDPAPRADSIPEAGWRLDNQPTGRVIRSSVAAAAQQGDPEGAQHSPRAKPGDEYRILIHQAGRAAASSGASKDADPGVDGAQRSVRRG